MINRVSDARLRDLSELNSSTEEGRIASELLAARAEIERLREDANTTAMDLVDERDDARADLREAEQELLAARSELQRLRTLIDGAVGNRTADELKHLKFSYSNQNQIMKEL